MPPALTHFAARCGDHNGRAMAASPHLAAVLEQRLATRATVIGRPAPALSTGWAEELAAASESLLTMARHYESLLSAGRTPVTALSRCAVALATLPVVARHRPDAVVVWFDAHADLNTPDTTGTGYLGGLALSGPLGLWSSGLGDGLAASNAVLVGSRDLDPPEQQLIDDGGVALVQVRPDMAARLKRVIADRPVYVHIDCDVLAPDVVPTDYRVAGGMTLTQLAECSKVLAAGEVVGLEIGELETADGAVDPEGPSRLIAEAVAPLLAACARR